MPTFKLKGVTVEAKVYAYPENFDVELDNKWREVGSFTGGTVSLKVVPKKDTSTFALEVQVKEELTCLEPLEGCDRIFTEDYSSLVYSLNLNCEPSIDLHIP